MHLLFFFAVLYFTRIFNSHAKYGKQLWTQRTCELTLKGAHVSTSTATTTKRIIKMVIMMWVASIMRCATTQCSHPFGVLVLAASQFVSYLCTRLYDDDATAHNVLHIYIIMFSSVLTHSLVLFNVSLAARIAFFSVSFCCIRFASGNAMKMFCLVLFFFAVRGVLLHLCMSFWILEENKWKRDETGTNKHSGTTQKQ